MIRIEEEYFGADLISVWMVPRTSGLPSASLPNSWVSKILLPLQASINGAIRFAGAELLSASEEKMRNLRGRDITMIFQEPMTALNPLMKVGDQVGEAVLAHHRVSRKEAWERSIAALNEVAIPNAAKRAGDYPHQLSGGLRQRVMIATALACEPKVLLADEPTTALDVTIQAQILALLDDLEARLGMATLLVTHDMGVVAGRADRISVMYAGRIVETAATEEIFGAMRHPYTQALLGSIPRLTQDNRQALVSIPGLPPDLTNPPPGCRFAPRCPRATDQCRAETTGAHDSRDPLLRRGVGTALSTATVCRIVGPSQCADLH